MEYMRRFAMLLKRAYTKLYNYEFKVEARMSSEKFSRESKLGFAETCLIILRGSKRSLQTAIYTFLKESKSEIQSYSKQAFSEKRQFIKPEAFLELFRTTTEDFYTDSDFNPKHFHGFHVFAIDGTTYNLPNTEALKEIYGVQTSQGAPQVQAKGSCLYDVLNDVMIDVKMLPVKSSERETAVEHLRYLQDYKPDNNLVILDRGYPSLELIRFFDEHKMFYLMRCNKSEFISEVRKVTEDDSVIQIDRQSPKTKGKIRTAMRVVHIPLDNGVVETLITNLLDSSLSMEDFKYLYHLRWGIEVKYDELKNKLNIEAFSGTTPVAVLQDFYATMFLTNLVSSAEKDCESELESINNNRERKYEYRINNALAISSVKDSFIAIVMEDKPRKQKRMLKRLGKRLLANVVPVRPGRSYERRRTHNSSKFPNNRSAV
jgi:hypothetical protein